MVLQEVFNCEHNKVPGHPPAILIAFGGSGSYFKTAVHLKTQIFWLQDKAQNDRHPDG